MSWRTVVVSKRCKLDFKMNYMVIRGEETTRIFLDEIALVIIENPAVAITGCLLEALAAKKIKVIFCNSKRSPYGEPLTYYGSFDCPKKQRMQIAWGSEIKDYIWKLVIQEKILNQARLLCDSGMQKEGLMLEGYAEAVEPGDLSNREGHAAKVYFNALFGMEFKRSDDSLPINALLDYGYSILLSAFNRAVCSNGYSTIFGIHHDNVHNCYNLSSDLMEPYRSLVDRCVKEKKLEVLDKDSKYAIVNILNSTVNIRNSNQTVLNSIEIYVKSVFNALNTGDIEDIMFYNL